MKIMKSLLAKCTCFFIEGVSFNKLPVARTVLAVVQSLLQRKSLINIYKQQNCNYNDDFTLLLLEMNLDLYISWTWIILMAFNICLITIEI